MALTPRQRQARRLWMARALGLGYESTTSTLALSLFFTSATAASGTVTDTEGTGNTLTFTRASTATYWDGDGVLQTAASGIARVGASNRKPVTNLLSYPEQFNNAAWTNSNTSESSGQADPFGGTNAFKLTELDTAAGSTHYIEATTGITVRAQAYTHSVYAKAGERTWIRLGFATAAGVGFFNLSTGEVGTTSGLDGYGIAPVAGATGWYRCWITDTLAAGTDKPRITIAEADNDVAYDGDGSSGLYIFGAQLNEGGIEDYIGATSLSGANDKAVGSWSQFGDPDSVTSNSTVAPDGTTTADTLADNNSGGSKFVQRSINVVLPGAGTYNYSCFFKANGLARALLVIQLYDSDAIADINLSTGATSGTASNIVAQYYGNGWYRLSCTFSTTTDLNGFLGAGPTQNGTNTAVDSDGTSSIYVWGHQVTRGSTLYPYVGMPQTGYTKQGYLAEAAATNLVTDSEDFSAAAWTINNTDSLTVTTNQLAAPDGTTTADEIKITDTTAETHLISDSITISSATDYAISCFLKADEQRYVGINLFISSENFATVVYDLYGGTVAATDVGTTSGTVTASGIIPVGNGWYRAWASLRVTGTAATIGLATYASASPTFDSSGLESYAGTANDAFHAWGMMVETGTYPSSYIRTSGGTATRAADVLRDTDLGWYTNGVGTFVATAQKDRADYRGTIFSFGDNTAVSSTDISLDGQNDGKLRTFIQNAGSVDYSELTLADYKAGSRFKVAYGFEVNDVNAAANGASAGAADTSCAIPTVNQLTIGAYRSTASAESLNLNGFIRSLQYYSERKSDADLATLSTITDDGTTWRDDLA